MTYYRNDSNDCFIISRLLVTLRKWMTYYRNDSKAASASLFPG